MDADQAVPANQSNINSFEFSGKAREYFSIWIVNICLTILTLGIYSAWAKVRTNQYFYGNTRLDDVSFRYLASPINILKGRLIAFGAFVIYYLATMLSPVAAGIIMLVLMLLVPALLVLSMSFRLRNSAYRNVKFDFDKNFKQAYKVFALPVLIIGAYVFMINMFMPEPSTDPGAQPEFPVLIAIFPLLIMLLFPWWEFMITQFRVLHAKFGEVGMQFNACTSDYYKMYLFAFFVFMLAGILFAVVMGSMGAFFSDSLKQDEAAGMIAQTMTMIMVLMFIPLYLWFFAYIQTRRTNLLYNNIDIENHQLQSDLKTVYMMYLYFTNTLAMVLSLGLLTPWAKIRTARYRASRTSLMVKGDLNEFTAAQQHKQSALGEEMGDMFDLDLGF
ncbi:MAG: YjgN family protein [Gammaproteobacteria bacterium]|nr:YjgN family protein [Gammaproteobacteria bacterium]MCW9004318.1 YjgN family protein [Gammaproteobacteria bacterium]